MADGIRDVTGGRQLMTYHPTGGRKSWEWFARDAWLDVHFFQSGHNERDLPNDRLTAEGYGVQPVKPVIDGEPRYEDHPVDWNPEKGWFEAFDVRQAAYWSALAGAAGHTYGDHNIWQMFDPRTGGATAIGTVRRAEKQQFDPPGDTERGNDWVLVVDHAAQAYAAPGTALPAPPKP